VANIEIPASWSDQLNAYAERLQTESIAAADKAVAFIHERVVARASADPDWQRFADNIQVWSQDGRLIIGIMDEQMSSEAFALEYGDEVRPPSPLFRSMSAEVRQAGDVMREHMDATIGRRI
jgi:hypothetical protein